jgi:hypothetical protein
LEPPKNENIDDTVSHTLDLLKEKLGDYTPEVVIIFSDLTISRYVRDLTLQVTKLLYDRQIQTLGVFANKYESISGKAQNDKDVALVKISPLLDAIYCERRISPGKRGAEQAMGYLKKVVPQSLRVLMYDFRNRLINFDERVVLHSLTRCEDFSVHYESVRGNKPLQSIIPNIKDALQTEKSQIESVKNCHLLFCSVSGENEIELEEIQSIIDVLKNIMDTRANIIWGVDIYKGKGQVIKEVIILFSGRWKVLPK